jgi:hypothetical protein
MCFSVSAGWGGGLRHNPDPVATSNLQQAREQHPHLPLQAQQPRQYTPAFPLPVLASGFLFPVVPLNGSALAKDFPYSHSAVFSTNFPTCRFKDFLRFTLQISYF